MKPSQENFCQYYVDSGNATKSAIEAGYSKRSAYSQGQRLLKNDVIQQRLEELQKPAQDILRNSRTRLIGHAVKIAMGEKETAGYQVMNKLLDKLLPTISESKTELGVKTIEDYLAEFDED